MGKTPKEIRDVSPGVAASKNVIHSSTSESNNQSIGVLAEDVSRLQTSVKHYSASSGIYKLDDIVLDPNIGSPLIYINTIAVTVPELFDPTKWRLTGISSIFNSKGDLLGYTGTDPTNIPVGSDNQVLTADGVAASGVSWKTPVQYSPPVTTKGDIFGFDTEDKRISVGTNDQVLTADSAQALGVAWKTPVQYSPPLSAKGDIFGFDTEDNRIPVGTNNQVLTADSIQALGVAWKTPALEEIGRVEVTSNSSTINVTLSKQKKNLFVKFFIIPTSTMLAQMRFNNTDVIAVSELMVDDFTTVSSQTSDNDIQISDVAGEADPMAGTIDITNIPTQIKQGMVLKTGINGITAVTTPSTKTNTFKWIDTDNGISSIQFIVTDGAGLYGIGSYVIVYGFD